MLKEVKCKFLDSEFSRINYNLKFNNYFATAKWTTARGKTTTRLRCRLPPTILLPTSSLQLRRRSTTWLPPSRVRAPLTRVSPWWALVPTLRTKLRYFRMKTGSSNRRVRKKLTVGMDQGRTVRSPPKNPLKVQGARNLVTSTMLTRTKRCHPGTIIWWNLLLLICTRQRNC